MRDKTVLSQQVPGSDRDEIHACALKFGDKNLDPRVITISQQQTVEFGIAVAQIRHRQALKRCKVSGLPGCRHNVHLRAALLRRFDGFEQHLPLHLVVQPRHQIDLLFWGLKRPHAFAVSVSNRIDLSIGAGIRLETGAHHRQHRERQAREPGLHTLECFRRQTEALRYSGESRVLLRVQPARQRPRRRRAALQRQLLSCDVIFRRDQKFRPNLLGFHKPGLRMSAAPRPAGATNVHGAEQVHRGVRIARDE